LSVDTRGRRKDIRKVCRRENMVESVYENGKMRLVETVISMGNGG
jgi:hypothetical protein